MLTLKENAWNFQAIKILSALNFLPIEISKETGAVPVQVPVQIQIQRQSSKVRVCVWRFFFFVGLLHLFYMTVRFFQSTILEPEKYFRWDQFVIHFGCVTCYSAFYLASFRMFVANPREYVMIVNHFLVQRKNPRSSSVEQILVQVEKVKWKWGKKIHRAGPETEIESELTSNPKPKPNLGKRIEKNLRSEICPPPARPLLAWPPQYSLDELLVRFFPFLILITGFLSIVVFGIDPSRPQLLYSALPPDFQNWYIFFGLLAVEALILAIMGFSGYASFFVELMFFSKCQQQFQRMESQLRKILGAQPASAIRNRNGIGNPVHYKFQDRENKEELLVLRQTLKEMKELVVFIELFNRCFPLCILSWKICSLSLSIICYFFVIRHYDHFPFLAVFLGYCGIAITLIYTIMYEHAFSIPGKMERLKTLFLLTAQKSTFKSPSTRLIWAEMEREMKSIQDIGINVGSFYQMERESTPNFIDFVVKQVVSLLVSFPR